MTEFGRWFAGRAPRRLKQVQPLRRIASLTKPHKLLLVTYKLTAILEQDADGVFAYCPELKGCHTQGDTLEEALANLQEAAELYLETLKPAELRRLGKKTVLSTALEVSRG